MTAIVEILLDLASSCTANSSDWTRSMRQQVANAREEVDFLTREIEELKRRLQTTGKSWKRETCENTTDF